VLISGAQMHNVVDEISGAICIFLGQQGKINVKWHTKCCNFNPSSTKAFFIVKNHSKLPIYCQE